MKILSLVLFIISVVSMVINIIHPTEFSWLFALPLGYTVGITFAEVVEVIRDGL